MQRVDPFIPVSVHRLPPARTVAAPQPPQSHKQPAGGVDGFVRSRPVPTLVTTPAPTLIPVPATTMAPAAVVAVPAPLSIQSARPAKAQRSKRHRLRDVLGTAGFVAAVMAVGAISQTLLVGEILIAVYAVYALVRHVASRTTFMLALLSLVLIVVLKVIGKDELLAANYAVYSLLLAFVGVVTLAREVRRSKS